jgi:hypothetical protein
MTKMRRRKYSLFRVRGVMDEVSTIASQKLLELIQTAQ